MSTATITKASGTVDCNYLNLVGSIATGGATFYAGVNSTDGGQNTGWQFVADPSTVATISKASGVVECRYLVLKDNAAVGGADFDAMRSTDGGNVTGWDFLAYVNYYGSALFAGLAAVSVTDGETSSYLPFRSQSSIGQPGPSDPLTGLPRRPWTPSA